MTDDQQLVQKTLAGDMQAYRWLIKKHERLVFHMSSRMVPNPLEREELCQDIFLKVYEKLDTFQGESKLSTWIATIAYRMGINTLKKKKTELVDLDTISFKAESEMRSDAPIQAEDTHKLLARSFNRLPPVYRTVVTLFHLEQQSYEEISEITGMPVGTVKSYLFRARNLLKDILFSYKKEGAI